MRTSLVMAGALVLLAAGCTVGPNYQRPEVKVPAQWGEPLAGGTTNRDEQVGAWWKSFRDPELDSLIARAVKTNLDLRIAEARVRQARARTGRGDRPRQRRRRRLAREEGSLVVLGQRRHHRSP